MNEIGTFNINIPDDDIAGLKRRLTATDSGRLIQHRCCTKCRLIYTLHQTYHPPGSTRGIAVSANMNALAAPGYGPVKRRST